MASEKKQVRDYQGVGVEDKGGSSGSGILHTGQDRMFRRHSDGQLARLVLEWDGGEEDLDLAPPFMRLDRASEDIRIPVSLNPDGSVPSAFPGWKAVEDRESRPFTRHQVAQIAFEADKKLMFLLGQPGSHRREWQSLSETQRIEWVKKGPTKDQRRARLYDAIFDCFGEELGG